MEQKAAQDATIISTKPDATNDQTTPPSHDLEPNKPIQPCLNERHGSKNIFKVALLKVRGRSQKSKVLLIDDESRSTWRKLLGSMRPLHLQNSQSSPKSPEIPHTMKSPSEHGKDGFDSLPNSPISPYLSCSRYASAIGLNEMVQEEEEEIVEKGDHSDGDDMIDAKAEEFIAEFYLQMKLQKFKVTDRRYREISRRSLGL